MDETYLYPCSIAEAKRRDELALWRDSHRANIRCKDAIEDAIRKGFDGSILDHTCIKPVLEAFGYRRTAFVLANTIQDHSWDGRYSQENRAWAKKTAIYLDAGHRSEIAVTIHPAVLDGFVDLYREAYKSLGLFGDEHCEPDSSKCLDYTEKVVVLSPDVLKESCWTQQDQLWIANSGFGCSPTTIGRSVLCTCLGDGEVARWDRSDILGVLKPGCMPAWAEERCKELQGLEARDGPKLMM